MEQSVSGVGVVDKSFAILAALADRSLHLSELSASTGIARATCHRLAVALEKHDMVRRGDDGRFSLGYGLLALATRIDGLGPLIDAATPHLRSLSADLGESAQLYVRDGDERVCVAVAESDQGLRTIVPVGARLTLRRGSAAAVLRGEAGRGYVVSIAEREPGVASVSAAVVGADDEVVAALSVSGPTDRMGPDPGPRFGESVAAEAAELSRRWRRLRP